MKYISSRLILFLFALSASGAFGHGMMAQTAHSVAGNHQGGAVTDQGWPRSFVEGADSFSVYQPQIEQWLGNRIDARAAVAITGGQSKQATYGVLWFTARTEIDKFTRLVTMTDFQITKVSFPAAADRAETFQAMLQRRIPKAGEAIALDRLLADMAAAQTGDQNGGYHLKNDPPRIIFSTRPAILVLIDGKPVLRSVNDTIFQRVINTRVLIFADESSGKFYLHLMDGWMESGSITGPWNIANKGPVELQKAVQKAVEGTQVDLLDGSGQPSSENTRPTLAEAVSSNAVPTVYVSTEPVELLQTRGDPEVAPIEGTQLIYVANTENDIFIDTSTQGHYVLISGRWFRSQSMNGPWEYVPGEELPKDFANIPPTHAKADVLVSIPGTAQAKEALIANKIPQTMTVNRRDAILTVSYEGKPQFKPIGSTSLQYAINTPTPVIAVSGNSFYAVQSGVWFWATAPSGPWTVATSVPAVIYAIPPSSPLHYVTYVKVYGSNPETVYVGYTPGYYGTVACSSGVVVYGTGWYHPPYVGSYWYGWGWTYGYGAGFAWSTYAGWNVAFGIGYAWSSYYHPGAWYAAGYYRGGYVAAGNVYGQWGNVAYAGTRAGWANPSTGNLGQAGAYSGVNTATGARYNGRGFTNTNVYTGTTVSGAGGVAYNPNTGRAAAGQAGAVSNAYTGNAAAGVRGASYNPNTGVISGGAAGATYNASTGQITAGGRGFAYNTKTDTGVAVGKNNVYAGKDGNVYRYNKSDGLQQHTSSGWSSVSRADNPQFQNQQSARAVGQQRWDNFRSAGPGPAAGGRSVGSGGFTGGGVRGGSAPRLGGRRR
jgi:hypothetical protein